MGEARELVELAWRAIESGEVERLGDLFSEEAELATASAEGQGLDYVRRVFRRHHEAYPDLRHEVLGCIESGDGTEVALDMRFTGTHRGELHGPRGTIAATGRTLRWRSADHVRTRDGRIVSWRATFDRLAIREQLGLEVAAGERG